MFADSDSEEDDQFFDQIFNKTKPTPTPIIPQIKHPIVQKETFGGGIDQLPTPTPASVFVSEQPPPPPQVVEEEEFIVPDTPQF